MTYPTSSTFLSLAYAPRVMVAPRQLAYSGVVGNTPISLIYRLQQVRGTPFQIGIALAPSALGAKATSGSSRVPLGVYATTLGAKALTGGKASVRLGIYSQVRAGTKGAALPVGPDPGGGTGAGSGTHTRVRLGWHRRRRRY